MEYYNIVGNFSKDGLNPRFPKPCPRVDCLPSLGNARAVAVIWDMHVLINQLIECEISFKNNFYMDWNFEFLFCYLAAWHEVEQNKCKHDPQLSYNNKIRDLLNEMNFKDVVANQDVAVQNWWHFFSQPASNVHGTCKLSVSHHRTISSSPMS